MKLLAVIWIDDVDDRRFLNECLPTINSSLSIEDFRRRYRLRFGFNPNILPILGVEEWTKRGLDNYFVPLVLEDNQIRKIEALS